MTGSQAPELAILRVRRPSGRIATFEADSLTFDTGIAWVTGRWRTRVGLNGSEYRYSQPAAYGFPLRELVEVRR
jgi:hypothetical protein